MYSETFSKVNNFKRVIPFLLIDDGYLVKPVSFKKKHQYIGDPINAVKIFNEKEVDELVVLDISARRKRSHINLNLLERISSEAFMPVAYGGGISDLETALQLNHLGVEKLVFGTAAVQNPELLGEVAARLGSQAVTACFDYKRVDARQEVFVNNGKKRVKRSLTEVAKLAVENGAGELVLQCINREGTRQGFDLETLAEVLAFVDVPVVVSGGAGNLSDIENALSAGAAAVGVGTIFVTRGIHRAVLISYPSEEELRFMKGSPSRFVE